MESLCDVPVPEHEGLAGGQDGGDDPGRDDHDPGSPLHVSRLESPQRSTDDQISEEELLINDTIKLQLSLSIHVGK